MLANPNMETKSQLLNLKITSKIWVILFEPPTKFACFEIGLTHAVVCTLPCCTWPICRACSSIWYCSSNLICHCQVLDACNLKFLTWACWRRSKLISISATTWALGNLQFGFSVQEIWAKSVNVYTSPTGNMLISFGFSSLS